MEQLGTLHDKLDIKILILFVLNQLPAPVDAEMLYDQVFCDAGIGYFDYADCLAGLVDTARWKRHPGNTGSAKKARAMLSKSAAASRTRFAAKRPARRRRSPRSWRASP